MAYKKFIGGKYSGTDGNYTTKYTGVVITADGTKSIATVNAKNKTEALRKFKNAGFVNTVGKWVRPDTKFDTSDVLNAVNVNSLSDSQIDTALKVKDKDKNK